VAAAIRRRREGDSGNACVCVCVCVCVHLSRRERCTVVGGEGENPRVDDGTADVEKKLVAFVQLRIDRVVPDVVGVMIGRSVRVSVAVHAVRCETRRGGYTGQDDGFSFDAKECHRGIEAV
jgi:hypothetical protein